MLEELYRSRIVGIRPKQEITENYHEKDETKIRLIKMTTDKITKQKIYRHLLRHQKKYLLVLALFVLGLSLMIRVGQDSPVFKGAESYYFLSQLPFQLPAENLFSVPIIFVFIPIIVMLLSIFFYYQIAEKLQISKTAQGYYLLLLILSPSFISSYSTLSGYALALLLVLGGCSLLLQEGKRRYFSIFPFIAATFIDGVSTLLLTFILIILWFNHKEKKLISGIIVLSLLSFMVNMILFHQQFFLGPFYHQNLLADIISDLGGVSGVSLVIIILAIIGLSLTWKQKNDSWGYLFLLPLFPAYFFSTQTVLYFSLITIFFATVGLRYLFQRRWAIPFLKNFTLFILLLSILFSSVTYFERSIDLPPTKNDQEMLMVIKENTARGEIVFSDPEYGPYITYFAQRKPFYSLYEHNKNMSELVSTILNSTYTKDTFPILEENGITVIYITPQMKEDLPNDQGLLFLFKNEKFKLLQQREDYEVWIFESNS